MNYKNIEKFEAWVKKTTKQYYGNISDYLEDLVASHGSTGTTNYELSSWETKSGRPETYSYEVEVLPVDGYDIDEEHEMLFIF